MLVILRGGPGDFNPGRLREVAGGGYAARVFRLDNGMPAGMQSSPNGAEFKQLLNDPNLPDEPVPTPTLPPGVVVKAPPHTDLTVPGTGSQTQVVQLKPGQLHLQLTGTTSPPPCPQPTPVPARVTLTNSRGMVIGPFETSVSAGLTTGFPGPGNNSVVPEAGEYTLHVTLPTAVQWELRLQQW